MEWKEFLNKYGYYAVHFYCEPVYQPTLIELKEWMISDGPRYTGWSPFWWPTRTEIAPQVVDQNTYECLHDGAGLSGHIERWRASNTGNFSIARAYDLDLETESPGKYLDLILPVWRISELLLYAGRMSTRFQSENVDFTIRYEGLSGRHIQAISTPNRIMSGTYTTKADRYEKRVILPASDIEAGVIDMTEDLIRGLFELFQFVLPNALCEEEIHRMKSNRF